MTGHSGPVRAAAFTPDGKFIVSCSGWPQGDKTIRLWDAGTGKEVLRFKDLSAEVNGIAISSDGKQILSGSGDREVRLWNAKTGELIRSMKGHEKAVRNVAISPDGRLALPRPGTIPCASGT